MTPDLRFCCVHHASTKSTTTTPVPTPEKDESPKRRPLLFSDLPLDIILDLGDILDLGSLCNLRLGSRGLRMALQTRFEKFCTDRLRAKPKLRIVSTWPLSLARATAITRYPAITQEILTVSIHVTIPVAAASIPGLAKACEQNDAVLTSKFLNVCETLAGGNVGENCRDMLSTILRRLSRTTTVKVKAKDFPLPVLKTSDQLDDLYNILADHVLQNRRTSSLATSESLERVLDSVAECRNNVDNLSIEILPESLGGHFALDGTRGFKSAKLNMNNLTSLDLLLPTWDTDEAPLRQFHTGQTCTFIEGVIIATPNLNDLSLSGTQKHAISASVISALCLVLKPDSLTMLDLQHIVATRDDLESLFLAQASTLRSLDLHGAALMTGSWHELALKLDGKLHLHDFHVGFLWNFRVGGYTCVTVSKPLLHIEQALTYDQSTCSSPTGPAIPWLPTTPATSAQLGMSTVRAFKKSGKT